MNHCETVLMPLWRPFGLPQIADYLPEIGKDENLFGERIKRQTKCNV